MNTNYDKIKWKLLGTYLQLQKVYGKDVNIFKCPCCRADVILYRRKGLIKLKCQRCNYENITKANELFKTNENIISNVFKNC